MGLVERYANRASDTLASGIDDNDLSLTLNDASEFSTAGNFRIIIDDELILVTAVSGDTFTVERGIEGTVAASHSSGATVTQVLTKGGVLAVGQSYDKTWGPAWAFTPPVDGDFAWINQDGASVDTTFGGILLRAPAGGSGASLRIRKKAAPATPYTIIAYFEPFIFQKAFHSYGMIWRQSSDGKLALFDCLADATSFIVRTSKFDSPTLFSADYQIVRIDEMCRWFKIQDDGVNRIASVSPNGTHWITFHTVGRTDFLTGDEVGFYAASENSLTPNLDVIAHLFSWEELNS